MRPLRVLRGASWNNKEESLQACRAPWTARSPAAAFGHGSLLPGWGTLFAPCSSGWQTTVPVKRSATPVSPQQAAGEKAAAGLPQSKVLRTPENRAMDHPNPPKKNQKCSRLSPNVNLVNPCRLDASVPGIMVRAQPARTVTMPRWTPETRQQQQAEHIRALCPCPKTTGTHTGEGTARSAHYAPILRGTEAAAKKVFSSFRLKHSFPPTPARTRRPLCSVRFAEKRCCPVIPGPSAAGTAALPAEGFPHHWFLERPRTRKEEVNHSSALMSSYFLKTTMPPVHPENGNWPTEHPKPLISPFRQSTSQPPCPQRHAPNPPPPKPPAFSFAK